jgi:tRNA-splicing ligase RtcB
MVNLKDLHKISDFEWEIPQSYRSDMRVPVRLFATRELLEKVLEDKSLEQAVNAATLPGLVGRVVVIPDMHQGYGFPIGGVAATRWMANFPEPLAATSTVRQISLFHPRRLWRCWTIW